ncbi:hypothetical protein ATY79_14995 [Rhizobium sp. R693]|nr:hypothetical protein ATY79_14995 [Rhizobium sp. R693]
MAARHLDVPLEEVYADTSNPPPDFLANNPLGKVPVLLRDDGPAIYDSVAIMHFLDRLSGGELYRGTHRGLPASRRRPATLQALALCADDPEMRGRTCAMCLQLHRRPG